MPPPPTLARVSRFLAKNKRHGFTLAEVLITLGLIGIIAAMTVPNLMQNWRKQERISQLKVAYSILQHATKMAVAEHGDSSTWDYTREGNKEEYEYDQQATSASYAETYFIPYVKTKDKGIRLTKVNNGKYKPIKVKGGDAGAYTGLSHVVQLDNGMLVLIKAAIEIPRLLVDVNGLKGPNRLGDDIFTFHLINNSIAPIPPDGNPKDPTSYNDCTQSYENNLSGSNCTYNIITNGWQFPDDYPIKKF